MFIMYPAKLLKKERKKEKEKERKKDIITIINIIHKYPRYGEEKEVLLVCVVFARK